jgi:hypothetical protein
MDFLEIVKWEALLEFVGSFRSLFKWDSCTCHFTGLRPLQGAVVAELGAKREKTRRKEQIYSVSLSPKWCAFRGG